MRVGVAKRTDPHQIDQEASHRHRCQHVCVDVGRVYQSCAGLNKHKESDDHEKQAVDEPGEDFNSAIPVGEDSGSFSAGHQGSEQA